MSRLLVPVGRPHLRAMADAPQLLKLYFLLADGCDKSRYTAREPEYGGGVFVRGYCFDRLEDFTYLFDLGELSEELSLDSRATIQRLVKLHTRECLEMLVIVPVSFAADGVDDYCESLPSNCIRKGYGLDNFAQGGCLYSGDGHWTPSFVRVVRHETHRGGFVQIPQEAKALPDRQLHFLVHVYSRAVFHPTRRIYNGRAYQLRPGEFVASYREIGRELDVHHKQVSRWADAALKLQLLHKIPARDDALWRVVMGSSKPKADAK